MAGFKQERLLGLGQESLAGFIQEWVAGLLRNGWRVWAGIRMKIQDQQSAVIYDSRPINKTGKAQQMSLNNSLIIELLIYLDGIKTKQQIIDYFCKRRNQGIDVSIIDRSLEQLINLNLVIEESGRYLSLPLIWHETSKEALCNKEFK
ncbi:hypothetical protein ACFL57_04370 [Candidatus Margulisiibacteriota bacterium]